MKFSLVANTATISMLLLFFPDTEARNDNKHLVSFAGGEESITTTAAATLNLRSSRILSQLRGGASVVSSSPLTSSRPRRRVLSLGRTPKSVHAESPATAIILGQDDDDDDAVVAISKQARVLQGVTFLFVFSFSVTALAPAPALIATLGAEKATTLLSLITGCGALVEILFSSQVGSLLDTTGRKPALVTGMILLSLLNAFVALHQQGSVPALCISKFFSILALSVFTLSSQAVLSDLSQKVATAVADNPTKKTRTSPEKWLSSTIGVNMALSGLGFLSGIMTAGLLSDKGGLTMIFGTSAIMMALASLLSMWLLVETAPPQHKQRANSNMISTKQRLRQLFEAPLSSTRLLYRHGPQVRNLAIVLMLLNLPMFQGDMFQVYSKQEWNLDTKSFSNYLALYGFVGIFANGCGSFLIQRVGTKHFTVLAIISRLISTAGAAFFGYKGAVVGIVIGFLGAAQTIGIIAALVSAGTKSGLPQGELAGERSSLLALLKVVGPFLYSFLYIQGSGDLGMPNLPLVFNIFVSFAALVATQLYLK